MPHRQCIRSGSIVFARLCHCAFHLIHAYLGPQESTFQTASQSVQLFLHSSHQSSYNLQCAALFPLKTAPWEWGIWTPSNNTGSLGPPESTFKWHLDQFSCFCRVHNRDKLTDHATPFVAIGSRQHLHSTVMRPKNASQKVVTLSNTSCAKFKRHKVKEKCSAKAMKTFTYTRTFDSDAVSSDFFGSSASCNDIKEPQEVLCNFCYNISINSININKHK